MGQQCRLTTINHDRLFKELLSNFFNEFLQLFLPEVAIYLDKTSVVFLDKEVITDVTRGAAHHVDLLVRARIKSTQSFFIIHVETQASRRKDFPLRMYRYFARLSETHALPVYPIAVFTFDEPQCEQPFSYKIEFPDLNVLEFNYKVIQLNQLDWSAYQHKANPVAAALMAKMRIAAKDRSHVKLECVRKIAGLELSLAEKRMLTGFVDTYLDLTKNELKHYREAFQRLDNTEQAAVTDMLTSWEREALAKGRREGRREGRKEGLVRGTGAGTGIRMRSGTGPATGDATSGRKAATSSNGRTTPRSTQPDLLT